MRIQAIAPTRQPHVGVSLTLTLLLGLAPQAARAELPPGNYDTLRISAQEALVIEVSSVRTNVSDRGTEVTVRAKVLAAERSKAGLTKGDVIVIQYTRSDLADAPGYVGPRPIPVLKKGGIYPAFLSKTEDATAYEPAASGMSFVMTPER